MSEDSPTTEPALPRSVLLACWLQAVLDGRASVRAAVRAVSGSDEPHRVGEGPGAGLLEHPVALSDDPAEPAADLGDLVAALRRARVDAVRVVLPVPGQIGELPGPAAFNTAALGAGEAVIVDVAGTSRWGVVPRVTAFGSAWEPGAWVDWTILPVREVPAWATTLAQTDRELRRLLLSAADELDAFDVADWSPASDRPGLAEPDTDRLPAGFTPHMLGSLTQAWRVLAITRAAERAARPLVDGGDTVRRLRIVHELGAAAARALAAAANAPAEPVRRH